MTLQFSLKTTAAEKLRTQCLVLPRGGKHFSEMVDRAIIPQIEGI